MKKVILTGDRPTGRLHIGHYVGSLRERVKLQNSNEFDEIYIMIADVQALTDNFADPQKIRDHIFEVALDYLACGIDPAKSTIFIQSSIPALYELTVYYMNLVTLARLERNPTVKSELKTKNLEESIPVGFLNYPISQAADITAFDATVVPVGDDQLPMLEQTREIVRSFNRLYGETLILPQEYLSENAICCRLPGIDGSAKMSKSLNNCIYLADESAVLREKVFSMYTDPNHLRVEDPGKVEGNTVFDFLNVFAEDYHFPKYLAEFKDLDDLKNRYRAGGVGDVTIKKFLFEILDEILSPIRERRKELENQKAEIMEILAAGNAKANEKANETLARVRKAMKLNYFE